MDSKLSRWCDGLMEIGWLVAIVSIPLFFNIHSDRVFEPDKITLLRSIALVMVVAWLVKFIDQQGWEDIDWLRPGNESSVWRMPFVLPIFLLVIVYLISTLFSVTPTVSLLGSYQRLQGTYTTFSYIVIFALMIAAMRSWEQVQRVVTAVIITSIPIAFYGMLQRFGLDPLPWGGNTQRRIAGHMGNSIFIAAYLIMALPLTAARIIESFTNILNDEELSYADVVRSSIYIFALAIQFLAIFWTRSRGPFVGLGVGMFAFGLIVLVSLRNASGRAQEGAPPPGKFIGRRLAPALSVLIPALGALIISSLVGVGSPMTSFIVFVAGFAVSVLFILILVAMRRGWQWLWLGWILLAVLAAGWFVAFNLPPQMTEPYAETPLVGDVLETMDRWRELPEIGRLGTVLEDDVRTGRVRVLIWQGALELITPHEPLEYPDGSDDSWNILRPLIGYGPESMYVAYNRFYPPELATIEARNASPDRSHNETFDALVITGLLGFLVWQILYISVFYYAFRWLGVVRSPRDRNLLILFWILGGAVMTAVFVSWRGPEYFGVALPFGSIGGLVVYLVYYALFAREGQADDPFQPERLLMIGLVTAVLAHYVEIHFGIAIVATRLHFFAYVGLMFVVGYWLPRLEVEAEERRRRRSRARAATAGGSVWRPVLLTGLLLALMVGIIGFTFTTYSLPPEKTIETAADLSAGEIFHQSLFLNAREGFVDSPFVFLMIVLTWILGSLVSLSEMVKRDEFRLTAVAGSLHKDRRRLVAAGFALMLLVTLGGVVYQYLIAPPATVSGTLGRTGLLIWTLLTAYATVWLYLKRENARFVAGIVVLVGLAAVIPLLVAGAVLSAFLLLFGNGVLLYLLWDGEWRQTLLPPFLMSAGALIVGFLYTYIQAGLVKSSIAPQTTQEFTSVAELRVFEASLATSFLTMFYVFIVVLLLAGAFILAASASGRRRRSLGSTAGFVALLVLAPLSLYAISQTNVRVIQADVVFKRGKPFDQQAARLGRNQENLQQAITAWDNTIAVYEEAIDLAPREDFYYLFLGRSYLERSTIEPDPAQRQALFEEAETRLLRAQDINPLNTDHTANLARLNTRLTQLTQEEAQKQRRLELAESYYQDALSLSPQNSIIRNEYASLTLELKQDCEEALQIYDRSVEVDPFFSTSYFARADAYITCAARQTAEAQGDYYQQAVQSLEEGLEREPGNARAWLQAGQIYQELAEYEEAVAAYDEALAQDGRNQIPAWNINYLKALAYVGMEDDAKAETAAKRALDQAPPEATPQIQQLLQQVGAEVPVIDETSQAPSGEVTLTGERPLAQLDPAARNNYFDSPPPMVIDPAKTYEAVLVTEKGDMRFRLFAEESPVTVNNFVFLARQGFYDNTTFHRVLEGFMAQGGDPTGTGAGGPGYQFPNEVDNDLAFSKRGILAMANAGPDTNGSQFFITFGPTPQLTGGYTIFGELIRGDAVLDQITRRDPTQNPDFTGDRIEGIEIIEVEG